LQSSGQGPVAYELKCLVEPQLVDQLVAHVAADLQVDPFSARARHGYYRITTLATDTSDWQVFRRQSSTPHKYRIRRYGEESVVYLERKTRRGVQVRKQRAAVHIDDLASLDHDVFTAASLPEPAQWFAGQVRERQLRPACVLACERLALMGLADNGTIRLTFDRHLSVSDVDASQRWLPRTAAASLPVTDDLVVCEFKFCGALPAVFKSAIERFGLAPGGFSKFRQGLSRWKGWSISARPFVDDPTVSEQQSTASKETSGVGIDA
jgi:hypothetical protein